MLQRKKIINRRYAGNMPILAIALPGRVATDYPFDNRAYRRSYLDFARLASSKFNVFFVRKKHYLGRGVFSQGYFYSRGILKKWGGKIYPKIVFNKCGLDLRGGRDWSSINHQKLNNLAQNKYLTYCAFPAIMKPTYLISRKSDLIKAGKKIITQLAVYKPLNGAGGRGIIIASKKALVNKTIKTPGILQEFIETSDGIPGLIKSRHDLRLIVYNGRIIQSFLRLPKVGSLLSNVNRGGRIKEIKLSAIPRTARKMAHNIDRQAFKKIGPRLYSVDLGFENNRPYLFEINSQPGLPFPSEKMYYRAFHRHLLKTLTQAIIN